MSPSHQTVRLSVGRHHTPAEGMCVMELASVLAGERFSDHPSCVCPIVGALLRGLNDHLPDDLRQRMLARWAAEAVGTRVHDPGVIEYRAAVVRAAVREVVPRRRRRALGDSPTLGCATRIDGCQRAGALLAAEAARHRRAREGVEALLEQLCGAPATAPPAPALTARRSRPARAAGTVPAWSTSTS